MVQDIDGRVTLVGQCCSGGILVGTIARIHVRIKYTQQYTKRSPLLL